MQSRMQSRMQSIKDAAGRQIPHPERLIHHVCPKFRLKSPNFIYKSSKIVSNLSQNLTCQLQLAAVFRLLLVRAGHKDDELIRIHVEFKSNSSRINSRICTWAPTQPRRICWICAARRLRRRGPYHCRRHRAPPRPARRPRRFRTSEGRRGSARSPTAETVFGPPCHCLLALSSGLRRVGTASSRR